MTTKITVVFDNPLQPEEFETGYHAGHLALAEALPGALRVEAAKVWPKEDGSPTPAYRLVDVYFADYDAACDAVQTPQAAVWFADLQRLASGGARVVFADVERGNERDQR
ncbi:EthD family reductase [Friedmanniella luteola]|nr:EthD family reductase [Friedmanniella luteola]